LGIAALSPTYELGVGLALAAMQLTRTVHAPAGADPLVVIMAHAPVSHLVSPVLARDPW